MGRGGEGASEGFQTETHQLCLWIPTAPAGASEQVHRGIKRRDTGATGGSGTRSNRFMLRKHVNTSLVGVSA